MNHETITPTMLASQVGLKLNRPIDDFPENIISIFGQVIPLIDQNGSWAAHLNIEHVGYTSAKIKWGEKLHQSDYMEWIIRCWSIERLEANINLKVIRAAHLAFRDLEILFTEPNQFEEAFFRWCRKTAANAAIALDSDLLYVVRSVYQWCIDEDLPGFSEHRLFELQEIRISAPSSGMLVTLRDEEFGPFTNLEISQIQNAVKENQHVTPDERAALYLARDWGLRPIQMSLLRTSDYGQDDLGPYVMVASVKGSKRQKLRHSPSNLVKRYISPDTAIALEAVIHAAPLVAREILLELENLIGPKKTAAIPIPIFCAKFRSKDRILRFIESPSILRYVLHRDSHNITKMFRDMTSKLGIRKASRFLSESDDRPLEISAYRFRRTKGTSMVLSGATPEEVAETLDHVDTGSVSYYFRYNLDLHDFVNSANAASAEINAAVSMWQNRIDGAETSPSGLLSIGKLGKCTLGEPCPHHPTVSCYACVNFRPSRNADHSKALADIESFQQLVASTSTGPISKQLEASIYGARSVILAITSSTNNE